MTSLQTLSIIRVADGISDIDELKLIFEHLHKRISKLKEDKIRTDFIKKFQIAYNMVLFDRTYKNPNVKEMLESFKSSALTDTSLNLSDGLEFKNDTIRYNLTIYDGIPGIHISKGRYGRVCGIDPQKYINDDRMNLTQKEIDFAIFLKSLL